MAALFAAALGIEREWRRQSAGFRTHILVSVGACLFTVVGAYAFNTPGESASGVLRVDISRVASQVVVGIGFLGGGAILKSGLNVRGLTTAANLWLAAAVGMSVGVGYYFAAFITVVVALLALTGLRPIERRLFGKAAADDDVRSVPRRREGPGE
ncbi:MAG: MgtC/SapB family protein [Myxococcaceae bacterium]|nr:MgtC/SapB family protein [Myxococcaceae bacterium]